MAFCKNCGQKLEEGSLDCKYCSGRASVHKLRSEYEKRINELEDEAKIAKFVSLRKQSKGYIFFAIFCIVFGALVFPFLDLGPHLSIALPVGFILGGIVDIIIYVLNILKANEAKLKYEQLSKRLDKLKKEMTEICN